MLTAAKYRVKSKRHSDREGAEQEIFMVWMAANYPVEFDYCFHVPNGGARSAATGAKLKREGVKRGVPDIFIELPKGGFHGLRIEFKATPPNDAPVSKEQKAWIARLRDQGYKAEVARGITHLKTMVRDYLALE